MTDFKYDDEELDDLDSDDESKGQTLKQDLFIGFGLATWYLWLAPILHYFHSFKSIGELYLFALGIMGGIVLIRFVVRNVLKRFR